MRAQYAALRRGVQRLEEVAALYTTTELKKHLKSLLDYSEALQIDSIKNLRPGTYSFVDYLDNDGITPQPVKINVTATIADSTAIIDFTGTDPIVRGPVNAPLSVTTAAVSYVFRALATAEHIPVNAGCLRPVTILVPEGCFLAAEYPAPVAAGNVETSQRVVDCLLGALSKAAPSVIPAAGQGTMNNFSVSGNLKGSEFSYYETIGGGMGAREGKNGTSGIHVHMTNTLNTPVEIIEYQFPFQITEYSIRKGSGGPGKCSGGNGIVRSFKFNAPCSASLLTERRIIRPYGLDGGKDGLAGGNWLVRGGNKAKLPGKCDLDLKKGDILLIETPGGGGYGKAPYRTKKRPRAWL
ncbi:MAG: hydantoinase B/oxoprolinase family protein [Deltaproteobacteria bacterium]|nr:hydantoinase B/oxoprolinase family protein [Deltaproteobacteria bacterium]